MNHSGVTEFQQLCGSWTTLVNRLYDDPKVSQLMNTRIGQYLSSHPALALTVVLFSTIAVLPVGLFLIFALVTIVMSAVGFVFFEVFLLFVGGLSLLCVLSGIALFSVVASFVFSVFYMAISNVLKIKQGKVQEKEREISQQTEMQ
uniref:lipid droplet assembly factor 1-like n=1 Tax=Scatophagus argus TaxID=75038 RepID=UPI001ED8497A|nr:lipid droplet assembly factor 1-like [Scatophagus argus]XP_046271908.1 lipid droplet assembly factor 1-like [Scatophagus argus]XP_046271909.1 lipid droplet assembly factor 1-like [Scatophagus argus]XP_046271910.1 lipid droplet assembly factor 1-like [Scatophagus argus]XP_046271911.1 lipid droplet assembly factor 1-like [Scatophagus argus]XP_046271912.1 lipid droplet assembly factor 1-like [Scatophagus argus]